MDARFTGQPATHPHELAVDLGAIYEIRGFRYLARQDSSWNGAFAQTEFYIGKSPEGFQEPIARVTFQKVRTPQVADCACYYKARGPQANGTSVTPGSTRGAGSSRTLPFAVASIARAASSERCREPPMLW